MERSDWQLKLSSHKERCKYAFNKSLFCDVKFLVVDCEGKSVVVPASKYPLAVCSPVFEDMFYGKLAETTSPIHLPDCTKEGLREILRYAHYEEANLTGSNVMEVLYLAKKYMMPSLEEKCQHYIRNEVGPNDVLSILPQVQKMGDSNLEKHFWEIVDTNTEEVISSESLLKISRELLHQLIQRDTLKVKELNLFKAVDKWVTKKIEEDTELVCNGETKRAILGEEIIRLIRFPLLTQRQFAEVVLPCKILDITEVTEVISFLSGVALPSPMFLQTKRSASAGALLISDYRFQQGPITVKMGQDKRFESINFTVNKAVNLVGVRFFGIKGASYEIYDLTITKQNDTMYDGKSRHVCADLSSVRVSVATTEKEKIDGMYYGFTVYLDKPVSLDPGVSYNIRANIYGPHCSYGQNGKRVVSAGNEITITYTDVVGNNGSGNRGTASSGQFPSLVLQLI